MTKQKNKIPDISVIVPIYNAAKHLRQTLESIIDQTWDNIEIICVDDGSTDSSYNILKEYAAKDSRIQIVRQKNQFAGMARNTGLDIAIGTYVAFLDSDDFFEKTLLEETFLQCEKDSSDICIYDVDYYDTKTNTFSECKTCLYQELLPPSTPFSWRDIPDHIFQLCAAMPCNKLYRRSMLLENKLRFPNLKRSEDSSFACMTLVCAQKISVVKKVLLHYRQSHGNNQQSGVDKTPLDFHKAQLVLKNSLQEHGLYNDLRCSYIQFLIGNGYYYLNLMNSADGYKQAFNALRNELLQHHDDINQLSNRMNPWALATSQIYITNTCDSHLFNELKEAKQSILDLRNKIDNFHIQLQACLKPLRIIIKKSNFMSKIMWGKRRKKYKYKADMYHKMMIEISDSIKS
mgnify:CR=1 FL=1